MSLQLVLKIFNHSQEWIVSSMIIPVCMNIHILAVINGDILIFNDPNEGNRWTSQSFFAGNSLYFSLGKNTSTNTDTDKLKGEKSSILQNSQKQRRSLQFYMRQMIMGSIKTLSGAPYLYDVRQQESAEIHNSKLAFKEELDKTAESKKNASQLTSLIIPYPKTVREQIDWLKGLLSQEIKNHKQSIKSYIAAFERKQKEKQTMYSMSCIKQFMLLFQQQRLDKVLPSKLYQSAMNELIALVQQDIADLLNSLSAEERHKYERIAKFNKEIMKQFENKVKYPQQVYSMQGMVNFNIMALFFWKNYRYRQKYAFQCLIPQRIANTLFQLTSVEYNRFEERFLDAIEFIDLKFANYFATALNLYGLLALTSKLAYMKRKKYNYKKTYETSQRESWESEGGQKTSFQFCQIALFPFYSKSTNQKKTIKVIEQITREMQEIASTTNKQLIKTALLKIKNDYHLSLKSTLQYFDKISQNPERKIVINPHEIAELYKQQEHIKWIYFTANTLQNNRAKDLQFYLEQNKLKNQLNPSTIVIFKMAMQRYKLMQRVNTSIIKALQLTKRPITFINRHVFSYSSIKETASHDKQQLIPNPATKKDILYTHVLGVRNGSVSFSAITDSKMIDNQYSSFLLDFCGKKLKINGESVVLYQFEYNRQVRWESLSNVLKGFKTKMQSDIIIVNNLKMFLIHYFVNTSVEWLLKTRSQELTTDNFGQMIKIAQAYIFKILSKARETLQKLVDQAINEDQKTYQSFFASMFQSMLQILMENQDEQVFLKNPQKYQHCNHNVQYSMLPLTQSKFDKEIVSIHHYEPISPQKKVELMNYMHQQFKKKYIYLDDCDKEEANTNFSILLGKYSMVSTDVRNILSRCSKFIIIDEVIIKEIERKSEGTTEDISKVKQLSQQIEFLKNLFEHQREKIESISPGQRQTFLKRALCMSKYPATQLKLHQ